MGQAWVAKGCKQRGGGGCRVHAVRRTSRRSMEQRSIHTGVLGGGVRFMQCAEQLGGAAKDIHRCTMRKQLLELKVLQCDLHCQARELQNESPEAGVVGGFFYVGGWPQALNPAP